MAEAFGNAWSKAGRFDEAIDWYTRARVAPDGTSSLAAVEQLANLTVRRAWEQAARTDARDSAARERARKDIAEAMALLDMLLAVGPTSERESLYGSAYKRLALIEAAAGPGRDDQELEAIAKMKVHYAAAEKIARLREADEPRGDVNAFYPAMNWIAAQLALEGGMQGVAAPDAEALAAVRRSMMAAPPDFWSVVGQTELNMYTALFAGALEESLESLTEEFKTHHERVNAPKRWATIHDNATFVLTKYKLRATPREVAAAEVLLETLSELAGQRPTPAKTPATRQRAKTPRKRRSGRSKRTRPSKRRPTPSIS